ncbi:hypothetical protein SLA2020_445980 [Shorea laevis]
MFLWFGLNCVYDVSVNWCELFLSLGWHRQHGESDQGTKIHLLNLLKMRTSQDATPISAESESKFMGPAYVKKYFVYRKKNILGERGIEFEEFTEVCRTVVEVIDAQ